MWIAFGYQSNTTLTSRRSFFSSEAAAVSATLLFSADAAAAAVVSAVFVSLLPQPASTVILKAAAITAAAILIPFFMSFPFVIKLLILFLALPAGFRTGSDIHSLRQFFCVLFISPMNDPFFKQCDHPDSRHRCHR